MGLKITLIEKELGRKKINVRNELKSKYKKEKIDTVLSKTGFKHLHIESERTYYDLGLIASKKLLNKDSNRVCSVCDVYSFDRRDDVYMSKFGCCNKCHIQWIEGREKRWTEGWRPKKENK